MSGVAQRERARGNALRCLDTPGSVYKVGGITREESITQNCNALLNTLNTTVLERYHRRDFSAVFERYIRNGAAPGRR